MGQKSSGNYAAGKDVQKSRRNNAAGNDVQIKDVQIKPIQEECAGGVMEHGSKAKVCSSEGCKNQAVRKGV